MIPNKPSLLVAPNGSGKSSFAVAFQSLKRDALGVPKEEIYNNVDTNVPELIVETDENEFRAFLNDACRRYSWLKPMLDNLSVYDGVEHKFIRKYLDDENYRISGEVLKQIAKAKRMKKIKIFVGNVLRKIGLRK